VNVEEQKRQYVSLSHPLSRQLSKNSGFRCSLVCTDRVRYRQIAAATGTAFKTVQRSVVSSDLLQDHQRVKGREIILQVAGAPRRPGWSHPHARQHPYCAASVRPVECGAARAKPTAGASVLAGDTRRGGLPHEERMTCILRIPWKRRVWVNHLHVESSANRRALYRRSRVSRSRGHS
jgi:hypothetical protein